ECREATGTHFIETLWQDIRYGLRMLRKSPGFTAVAVVTLALGIGANTAIFSVLEAQIWRSLPFPDSNHLLSVERTIQKHPQWTMMSAADSQEWLPEAQDTFQSICAFQGSDYHNTPGADNAEMITARPISSSFFETLRMPPVLGRAFLPEEQQPGRDHEVILSDAYWQSHYGSNSNVIGRVIVLDGSSYTIIGVAPAGLRFEFFGDPDMYVPLPLAKPGIESRGGTAIVVVAREKPGVPLAAAQARMDVIAKQLAKQNPQEDATRGIKLQKLRDAFGGPHQGLFFFAGAAGIVLLIACANVAGLLLARGLARQHEFAIRSALGAKRMTLLRQLLVEGALLGGMGGALGILAAIWGANALNALLPFIYRNVTPQLDVRVLAFALAISLAATILSALAPGLFASRVSLTDALQSGARGGSGISGHRRLRNAFVVAEVTLAVTLLFAAGLFLNSFVRQMRAPLGFDPHDLISFGLTLSDKRYSQPQNLWLAEQQILERVRAVPGIRDAGFASQIPFAGGISAAFTIVGQPIPSASERHSAIFSSITPDFFDLLKIPVLAGRPFSQNDAATAPRVAIVNDNLVHDYFGGRNPIGAELMMNHVGFNTTYGDFPLRIVGVVQNTHLFGPDEVPFDFIYAPTAQVPLTSLNVSVFLLASTNLPASTVVGAIRHQVAQVDNGIPITHVATMDDRVDESLQGARGNLFLIGAFAGLAVALVAVGIFGAVGYYVQQRTREFGIRLALGATPARILHLALKYSATLGILGVTLGVGVSLAAGRLLGNALYLVRGVHSGVLYDVSMYDPLTLMASCVLLVAVLFVASYVPARRAIKVDPMVALRYE
ncbi:MAG TPA: ABC transporter permease, partial [Candidatus Acidoferrales bacterium]|nr:ABC transporter permease [Candidatus Acidoferrales bacterium]